MLNSGKTPEEVCQGCPEVLSEVRERWRAFCLIDAQVRSLVPGLGALTAPDRAAALARPAGLPQVPGHELEAVLGQGGMGVVYRARQIALGRMVAVKMLPADPLAGPQELGRFRRETAALACLRHPNIVHVYEAGDVEGRPYFTMELVEGGSLARKLAGTPQPARQAAALVVTLAEAVDAAHQAGIVHRDLKPGNILLQRKSEIQNRKSESAADSDFGFRISDFEPKVTDFGLARRLEAETRVTQTGVLVGTPSYMAPEQARGQTTIGPGVDVYALGAILYELLTGRPPFRAETAAATVYQVIHHEPVPPSRLNFRVPRDLETICLKCLQKAPPHRYASAGALADDLRRFGEGRPIQARPVGWGARLWRWGRRNPAAAGLLAMALVVVGLASGGGVWFVQQRARHEAEMRSDIDTAVAQAASLRKGFHFGEARELLEQARQRAEPAGPDDLRRWVDQARADLKLAKRLDEARLRAATLAGVNYDAPGAERRYAVAFAEAGLGREGDNVGMVAARVRESGLRAEIVAGLDDWARMTQVRARREWLFAVGREADPHPGRNRLRQPDLWRNPAKLARVAREVGVAELSPQLATALGQSLSAADALELLSAAQARFPNDFWLNYQLAKVLHGARRLDEAIGYFRAALASRPDSVEAQLWLGACLRETGKLDDAIGHLEQAVRLDPQSVIARFDLANLLTDKGKLDEAIAHLQHGIGINPKYSKAYWILGNALRGKGKLDEAIVQYRHALRVDAKLSGARQQLGLCLQDRGRLDEAMAEYRRTIQLDPKWSLAHYQLGVCLQDRGQLDEAMAEYRRAIQLDPNGAPAHLQLGRCLKEKEGLEEAMVEFRRASQLDPKNGEPHFELGLGCQARGRLDEAVAEYRRAIQLAPKASHAHFQLGVCWQARGRLDEAMAEYRRAIQFRLGGDLGHAALADALLRSGRFAEARTAVRRGLDVLPAKEPRRPALREKLELCERLLALDARLPALLRGKERPGAAELLELGRLCLDYGRPHAAAGLYALAFAARPALADALATGNRYNAACAAARAGAGEGPDQARLGRPERAGLRRQALVWLRADLALRTRLQKGGKSVDSALKFWQTDSDLGGVRDPAALAKLPAGERASWQRLWADVAALRAADPVGQGRTHAARRQWAPAAASYARALKRCPTDDGELWFENAALLLLSGDRPGYARACAHLIKACGKAGGPRAYHVARACTLAEGAVAEASLPGHLAAKEIQASARTFWSLTEQGALHCRAGGLPEAVALFKQSLRADPTPGKAVLNWLWLALAQQRLGKAKEARRWLDKATAWLDQYRDGMPDGAEGELGLHLHNWLEAHVLRREAEALLRPAEKR
jgi:serine/threonine-protein kinase